MLARLPLPVVLALLLPLPVGAQVKAPPPPPVYKIEIRYEIDAYRNERARQFLDMVKTFEGLGFKRDVADAARGEDLDEAINREVNVMRGTIPSASIGKLLLERHVQTLLLVPATATLPAKDQPVRVDLRMLVGYNRARQQDLARQTLAILAPLSFKEAVGYDHRQQTRMLGQIPVGQLDILLNDPRRTPTALALLPRTLLVDLRRFGGGTDTLGSILLQWYGTPAGKKLLTPIIDEWRKTPQAQRLIMDLPRDVARIKDVVDEELLKQIYQHPDGERSLEMIWDAVLKSPTPTVYLDPLLRRIRGRNMASALPLLFRPSAVVRIIEVRPDLPLPQPRPARVVVPDEQRKLSPEVRALVADAGKAANRERFELILSEIPREGTTWNQHLVRVTPSIAIEGRLGPVVQVVCPIRSVLDLAALTQVASIRLPALARSAVLTLPNDSAKSDDVLKRVGLDVLHKQGKKGKKVRLAIIDGDFRGWETEKGKRLPASTRLIDFTRERNESLLPDPDLGPATTLGAGTKLALAALLAAPEAELTLIRIDPSSLPMLGVVVRRIAGQPALSEALVQRNDDLSLMRYLLNSRRRNLNAERREVQDLFSDNLPQSDPELKKRQQRRDEYLKKEAQFEKDETEFLQRIDRFLMHRRQLETLKQTQVVVCGLTWTAGFPVAGTSALSQLIDELLPCTTLWWQAADNTPGQAWTGLFLDEDGNGRMGFLPSEKPLVAGTWDRETNFLAWQPWQGATSAAFPAQTRVRLSLQWREVHDPDEGKQGTPYRQPLTDLRIVVLKQLDPTGTKQPSDDLAVVGESTALPEQLHQAETFALYEHAVEFVAEAGVRYCVRVEGVIPDRITPPDTPALPLTQRQGEIRPRLLIEANVTTGRPLLASYSTTTGCLGVPADAQHVLTVGALNSAGKPQSYTVEGAPYLLELSPRPHALTEDRLGISGMTDGGGSGFAAGFASGLSAALLSAGHQPEAIARELRLHPRLPLKLTPPRK